MKVILKCCKNNAYDRWAVEAFTYGCVMNL